jgi:hypothetical protein
VIGPYETAAGFRTALMARLRNAAQEGGVDLQRLQRRVAFERLLARLFAEKDAPWVLKGGFALELRLEDRARSTLDIDLSVPEAACLQLLAATGEDASCVRVVVEKLREAAARDLEDGFAFTLARAREEQTGAPRGGGRCSVEARLAGRTFARFHLDVGLGDALIDDPEWVEAGTLLSFAGIESARLPLYPVAQQFAEKLHSYTLPRPGRDNTRVKDLVDLVLLAGSGLLTRRKARAAARSTFQTRGTHQIPAQLPEPPLDWAASYAALATELGLGPGTLQDAHSYLVEWWDGQDSVKTKRGPL